MYDTLYSRITLTEMRGNRSLVCRLRLGIFGSSKMGQIFLEGSFSEPRNFDGQSFLQPRRDHIVVRAQMYTGTLTAFLLSYSSSVPIVR